MRSDDNEFLVRDPRVSAEEWFMMKVAACINDTVLGMIGMVMQMGLTQVGRYSYHWSRDPDYDFAQIHNSITRELFALTYARFLHFSTPKEKLRHELRELKKEANEKKDVESAADTEAREVEMDVLEIAIGDILHHVTY